MCLRVDHSVVLALAHAPVQLGVHFRKQPIFTNFPFVGRAGVANEDDMHILCACLKFLVVVICRHCITAQGKITEPRPTYLLQVSGTLMTCIRLFKCCRRWVSERILTESAQTTSFEHGVRRSRMKQLMKQKISPVSKDLCWHLRQENSDQGMQANKWTKNE